MGKTVLVLFSGGKDSILSVCRLVEEGFTAYLVNFNNSCGISLERIVDNEPVNGVELAVKELIRVYGANKIKFLGTKLTIGTWRKFFLPYFNMKPEDIIKQYGLLTHSQFNCLTCRSTMYLYSIALCKELGIDYIAEGARTSQQFVIELNQMLDKYRGLLLQYNINLLLPVLDLLDDFQLINELMMSNIKLGSYEDQCLLGVPIEKEFPIDTEIIEAVTNFYDKEIEPKSSQIVDNIRERVKIKTPFSNEKKFF